MEHKPRASSQQVLIEMLHTSFEARFLFACPASWRFTADCPY
jgi:hypothetical protein